MTLGEEGGSGKNPRRVEAGRRNRLLNKGLTPEGRRRLAESARLHRPWLKSMGPRTEEGKSRASSNCRSRMRGRVSLRRILSEARAAASCLEGVDPVPAVARAVGPGEDDLDRAARMRQAPPDDRETEREGLLFLRPGTGLFPPDWRYLRAVLLARRWRRECGAQAAPYRGRGEDPWVVRLVRSLVCGPDWREQFSRRSDWARMRATLEFDSRGDRLPIWELEARMLAGQDDATIGARLGLDPWLVEAYGEAFFDVRGRLDAATWVRVWAIGEIERGIPPERPRALWGLLGYNHGPAAVDWAVSGYACFRKLLGEGAGGAVTPREAGLGVEYWLQALAHAAPPSPLAIESLARLCRRVYGDRDRIGG